MISMLLGLVLGMACGLVGYWLRQNTKLSIVEVSAWLTLGAGLILPRLFNDGWLFALICTAISYAVMSSADRISNYWEILIISGLCTLVVFLGQNVLVGVGGRLGTFAALSVLSFNILKTCIKRRDNHDQCDVSR